MPASEPSPRADFPPAAARPFSTGARHVDLRRELEALDVAVYAAIAASPTPTLDRGFSVLSRAADYSKLWLGAAGVLAAFGGARGRRAAGSGLASVVATSSVVNLALKPLGARRRPDRALHRVPIARYVDMPRSTSFPAGHSASAFAFASGVGQAFPPQVCRCTQRRLSSPTRVCIRGFTIRSMRSRGQC